MTLIVIFAIILSGILAWGAERQWNDSAIGVFSAVLGGLIAVIGQELYRQQEERARRDDALAALRVELEFNIGVQQLSRDEKHRGYSSSAWEQARPFLPQVKPAIADALRAGYERVNMHRQALIVELSHSGHGGVLTEFSRQMLDRFQAALSDREWLQKP